MKEQGKQPNSGYPEEQLKPSRGKPKLPGEGGATEPQNMPKKKPGKQSSA
ncbi:hypothetical protein EC912_105151 [Luteibacter rhizovicinus]|uniref:Uncharacterized protein n=1 Tax=Luteibacter rhizovicinus TaxID=242606 RepID=A0A4R3YM16_9GAMM|nr:hypothetical protein [Luteibacter rhizovicinus]TCV93291.1 hypothetical protein EC912_105151 [Luteibacter rhizovicinus]